MDGNELLRTLRRRATKLSIRHVETPARGSHVKVWHGTGMTIVPMHRADIAKGTFRAILKQLGLTEDDLKE